MINAVATSQLMSLLAGKSKSSCNAVSHESSNSMELEESEISIESSAYNLFSKSPFSVLPVAEEPIRGFPISAVVTETDPHLVVDEDA
ncbi:hypothetical protein RHMOL_Rhmol07G0020000 [Rhododendron molle]|uniref:Uncharacterized protein n=1 Tax=Rhododendron molle TaxID=49168 RepID=A0ACC0MVZ9_RHOML|nr:hypothetical protein RHMOL_Rhmol07G0020000 [Rhododendron molle]